jgi:Family of unknown function (DUF5675)
MSEQFQIIVVRNTAKGNLVPGTIWINGDELGKTYENNSLKIPAGDYTGLLRYRSHHHFVQGPLGVMSEIGDFLVEISGVHKRSNILFHTGNKPKHSEGCILLGPIQSGHTKSGEVAYSVAEDSPLRRMRLMFYGKDDPVMSPDKIIKISIVDP